MGLSVKLKPWQDEFVFSQARYPAMISGWGTGKTMCGIARAMKYSTEIPNNLGIIFRKQLVDLADSTIKDFESYTDLKVNSHREVSLAGGSKILFRHIEEMNNIQNVNLGWAMVEQVEENETDNEFFKIFGRLRRHVKPTADFYKDGPMPERSFWVIGNTGRDWVKNLWKINEKQSPEYHLVEATTFDNADVLPKDFLDGLELIRQDHPEIYEQFVMNSWELASDAFILIKPARIEQLKGVNIVSQNDRRLVVCDPALGGDECVIYAMQEEEIIDHKYLFTDDPMKVAGEMITLANMYGIKNYGGDVIGIGSGVFARISEIFADDVKNGVVNVYPLNSANVAMNPLKFPNVRSEMWWCLMEKILARKIPFPVDPELRRQLVTTKYQVLNSFGKIRLEEKKEAKKRLLKGIDRADAYVMGCYIIDKIPPHLVAIDSERLTPAYVQAKYIQPQSGYGKHNQLFTGRR